MYLSDKPHPVYADYSHGNQYKTILHYTPIITNYDVYQLSGQGYDQTLIKSHAQDNEARKVG